MVGTSYFIYGKRQHSPSTRFGSKEFNQGAKTTCFHDLHLDDTSEMDGPSVFKTCITHAVYKLVVQSQSKFKNR